MNQYRLLRVKIIICEMLLMGFQSAAFSENMRVFDLTANASSSTALASEIVSPFGTERRDGFDNMGPNNFIQNPFNPNKIGHIDSVNSGVKNNVMSTSPLPSNTRALQTTDIEAGPRLTRPDQSLRNAEIENLRALAIGQYGLALNQVKGATSNQAMSIRDNAEQAQASWLLGLLTLHGIGVNADSVQAVAWFERARLQGEALANAGLAWCDIEGCKSAPNPALARRWLAALRTVNAPRAQYFQWLIDTRLHALQAQTAPQYSSDNSAKNSLLMSRQLLISAAKNGDIQANLELGMDSAADNQSAQALKFFLAIAPRSEAAAYNVNWLQQRNATISTPYAAAAIVPDDSYIYPNTYSAASNPATDNIILTPDSTSSADELLARAKRNHRGEGQSSNFTEAIRLYRLAQNKGNSPSSIEARKMLELIFSRPGPGGELNIEWMYQLAYVDVTGSVIQLDNTLLRSGLRREKTPLFDLLPQRWRSEPTRIPSAEINLK